MHNHQHEISGGKLLAAVFLNLLITAVEIAGGLASRSLALLSDAVHNLGDGISLVISYAAFRLSRKKSTPSKTFGYKRAEILAALFNASALVVIIFFLFREAYHRFFHPVAINGLLMIAIAAVGLIANLAAVLLLRTDARHSLNIRSSYLHLVADTYSSIGVAAGGLFVYFFNITWVDPLLTVLIGLYILRECYGIVRQTVNILMQAAPPAIDVMKIKCAVEAIPEVHNLHHVHLWQANDRDIYFEGHIDLCEDQPLSRVSEIYGRIEQLLHEKFNIHHSTVQIEFGTCADQDVIKTC